MDFSQESPDISFNVKRRFLRVVDWSVRTTRVVFEKESFTSPVLDLVIQNTGRKACNRIEANVRYLGPDNKLLGIDHAMIVDSRLKIEPDEDRVVPIYLTVPDEARNAVISVNAEVTSPLKEHELLIGSVGVLLAAILIGAMFILR